MDLFKVMMSLIPLRTTWVIEKGLDPTFIGEVFVPWYASW